MIPTSQAPAHAARGALAPAEIEAAIADNDAYDFETVKRMLPQAELYLVDAPFAGASSTGERSAPERAS